MELVLRVTSGPHAGMEQRIAETGSFSVGRSPHVPILLAEDRLMSREHFRIEYHPPLCDLVDLGSTNGTKVNGLRVDRVRLGHGDLIAAGESDITVDLGDSLFELAAPLRCPAWPPSHRRASRASTSTAVPGSARLAMPSATGFPRTHPDYLIEKPIGTGGMGEVFLARQLSTNRPVAIKMMVPTGAASEKAKEYFHREMLVLRDLLTPGGRGHSEYCRVL